MNYRHKRISIYMLVFACVAILACAFTISANASQDVGRADSPVEDYVGRIEHIIININRTIDKDADAPYVSFYSWDNKDRYDEYRLDDSIFKNLIAPGDPTTVSLMKEIRLSLKAHLKFLGFMKDVQIMVHGEDEFDKFVKTDAWEKKQSQLWLTFLIGQQSIEVEGRPFLLGAISVDINQRGSAPDIHVIKKNFMPEPFIIDVEKADRESLRNSVEILTFKIADYLSYKKMNAISKTNTKGEE